MYEHCHQELAIQFYILVEIILLIRIYLFDFRYKTCLYVFRSQQNAFLFLKNRKPLQILVSITHTYHTQFIVQKMFEIVTYLFLVHIFVNKIT